MTQVTASEAVTAALDMAESGQSVPSNRMTDTLPPDPGMPGLKAEEERSAEETAMTDVLPESIRRIRTEPGSPYRGIPPSPMDTEPTSTARPSNGDVDIASKYPSENTKWNPSVSITGFIA